MPFPMPTMPTKALERLREAVLLERMLDREAPILCASTMHARQERGDHPAHWRAVNPCGHRVAVCHDRYLRAHADGGWICHACRRVHLVGVIDWWRL